MYRLGREEGTVPLWDPFGPKPDPGRAVGEGRKEEERKETTVGFVLMQNKVY